MKNIVVKKGMVALIVATIMSTSLMAVPPINVYAFDALTEDDLELIASMNSKDRKSLVDYKEELPSKYDGSTKSYITPAKSQFGPTCALYATVAQAEAAVGIKYPNEYPNGVDLSETDMGKRYFNVDTVTGSGSLDDLGGNEAFDYLDDGFLARELLNVENSCGAVARLRRAAVYEGYGNGPGFTDFDSYEEQLEFMKRAIKKYGSVGVGIFGHYAENDGKLYMYNDEGLANHQIALIGWDDTIPRELFKNKEGAMPGSDGGFIAKDSNKSWTYTYISYENATISHGDVSIFDYDKADDVGENIYQKNMFLGDVNSEDYYSVEFDIDKNRGGKEQLNHIGYDISRAGEFDVSLIRIDDDSREAWEQDEDCILYGTSITNYASCYENHFPAYYTLDISDVILEEGKKYAVVFNRTGGPRYYGYGDDESFVQLETTNVGGSGNYGLSDNIEDRYSVIFPNKDNLCDRGITYFPYHTDYTGDEIKPEIELFYLGRLVDPSEYEVSYTDCINAGKGMIHVNYKGVQMDREFEIYSISCYDNEHSFTVEYDDTSLGHSPKCIVKCDGKELKLNEDYTLFIDGPMHKKVGDVIDVYVSLVNNYRGELESSYTVTAPKEKEADKQADKKGTDDSKSSRDTENSKPEKSDTVVKEPVSSDKIVVRLGNAEVSYVPEISFAKGAKKAEFEPGDVELRDVVNGGNISYKKIKVRRNGKTGKTTFKIVGARIDKGDKETRKAVKKAKLDVEIKGYDVSESDNVVVSRNTKGKIKKVTVNGLKLKKKEYREENGRLVLNGRCVGEVMISG